MIENKKVKKSKNNQYFFFPTELIIYLSNFFTRVNDFSSFSQLSKKWLSITNNNKYFKENMNKVFKKFYEEKFPFPPINLYYYNHGDICWKNEYIKRKLIRKRVKSIWNDHEKNIIEDVDEDGILDLIKELKKIDCNLPLEMLESYIYRNGGDIGAGRINTIESLEASSKIKIGFILWIDGGDTMHDTWEDFKICVDIKSDKFGMCVSNNDDKLNFLDILEIFGNSESENYWSEKEDDD